MKRKLIIGLDLNEVIFSFFLCRFFSEVVIERLFLIMSSQKWLWKITRVACFFTSPVEGATKYINWLLRDGHEIKIVTSLGTRGLRIAKELIYMAFGREFEIVGVGYGKSKLKAVTDFKLNVFVDSEHRKLISLVGAVKHLIWFSRRMEYKRENEIDVIERVCSWEELYEKISAFSNEDVEIIST